ncbi:MAG: hypothetical protein JOZ01_01510 [Candidatus Eremiobacteraeota bacterium]|nr:hypothetical protein [Candidatus Eremiobacteraeota bacterium]
MPALTHYVLGLAIAHVTLLVFFLIGSAAFPWFTPADADAAATRLMMRVTCTIGVGAAIAGLALFALGSLGGLTILGVSATLLLAFLVACVVRRTSPLRGAFWHPRATALVRCWNWPLAAIYLAMLAIATRAVIPEGTGYSDAIYYHFAYAQDWANAGRLWVDPFMAFIFYANNFVLFFTAWIVLHAGAYLQFLTWTAGLLTALALYATIDDCGDARSNGPARAVIGLLIVASVISSAIFLDYSVLGYIDVPIGAMALLAVVALRLALVEDRPQWLAVAAVLAGFLVGMKGSFIALLPVFAVALVWAAATLRMRAGAIAAIFALLCAVASPWYVRNWILAGDPIAPALNIALHGQDGLWKTAEWNGLWQDMATSKSPRAFLTLPIRAYAHPTMPDFREYGASGLILFLYVPALVALGALLLRRRLAPSLTIPIFVVTCFALYWFVSTSLLRYALLFYALLGLCVGMLLVEWIARRPRLAWLAVALALVAALPVFPSLDPNGDFIQNDILSDVHAFVHYRGEQAFLDANDSGYADSQLAAAWMRRHGYSGNIYVISDNAFDYYFRRDGVLSIGNWTGPAGYFRLLQAVDAGEAAEFLNELGTHAVFFSPQQLLDAGVEHVLAVQLKNAGYREVPLTRGTTYHLYVRG